MRYFRAEIDFTVVDDDAPIVEELDLAAEGEEDLPTGSTLQQLIEAGVIEIDGVNTMEAHS